MTRGDDHAVSGVDCRRTRRKRSRESKQETISSEKLGGMLAEGGRGSSERGDEPRAAHGAVSHACGGFGSRGS